MAHRFATLCQVAVLTGDIGFVADPARNFVVIMKDGRIHRNTLGAGR